MRIAIHGSCSTRDAVPFWDQRLELVSYVARQSIISAVNPAPLLGIRSNDVPKGWRRAQYVGDVRANALEVLTSQVVDKVVLDITDERLGVQRHLGGWITHSEWSPPGALVEFGSREHHRLWCASLETYAGMLDDIGLLAHTVVNAMPWAMRSSGGVTYPAALGWNQVAPRYYAEFDRYGIPLIATSPVAADDGSRWGRAPFHLDDTTLSRFSQNLLDFIER